MASLGTLERLLAGFVIAAAISAAAYRSGSLSPSGAVAAIVVGIMTIAAGWAWGALLVSYFVISSLLSRFGRGEKERRTGWVVEKGGARDVVQVAANGGVFAAAALLATFVSAPHAALLSLAALGALAAATADTWATEIGTLFGGTPRALLTLAPVEPGTSGAVSVAGLVAMLAGAAFIAWGSAALGLTMLAPVVLVAGVAGAMTDSLLGATLQSRRWCASCECGTERRIHGCGATTSHAGGLRWMDNDMVNLLASLAGAAIAVLAVIT
jgi:uncharacterized protein (TIGR00297 family)